MADASNAGADGWLVFELSPVEVYVDADASPLAQL
jgi:hypothetical protein